MDHIVIIVWCCDGVKALRFTDWLWSVLEPFSERDKIAAAAAAIREKDAEERATRERERQREEAEK
jgi:hypothetical protein